jgi:hypothetical protein
MLTKKGYRELSISMPLVSFHGMDRDTNLIRRTDEMR